MDMRDFFARMGILGELMQFFWMRKLYWLIPMLVLLVVILVIVVLTISSPAAPFIYTLF
jgi:hypothetical protein